MGKAIKSTDPRKPLIVAAAKDLNDARKITNVREGGKPGWFIVDALWTPEGDKRDARVYVAALDGTL